MFTEEEYKILEEITKDMDAETKEATIILIAIKEGRF